MALGEVDYGLMGVVGGLVGFISFFNGLLSTAVSRFFAISIGKEGVHGSVEEGLYECRKWFSTATFIHIVVPTMLMSVGYPLGSWCVRSFLTIPSERINDCVWVFRFVCVSCYLGMISIPVNAMYAAKQYIAELTVYSFVTTTLNVGFLYYIVTHQGVWLARYAFWTCCLSVLPQVIIYLRGYILFKECRIILSDCMSLKRIMQMLYFVGWWAIGSGGSLLRSQGIQILINKYFGANVNASMAIANTVNAHTMTLSGSMLGAFQPAIVSAYGAGDMGRMRSLAYRACKFAMLFILMFSIPLCLELKAILVMWLVNPPEFVYGLCMIMFVMTLIDQSSVGHMLAVNARGKIAQYQLFLGGMLIATLPIAWIFCVLGGSVYHVGGVMLITMAFCAAGRVWFARGLVGMSARYWFSKIFIPVTSAMSIALLCGITLQVFMRPCVARVFVTAVVCEIVFLLSVWFFVLTADEREYVITHVKSTVTRLL